MIPIPITTDLLTRPYLRQTIVDRHREISSNPVDELRSGGFLFFAIGERHVGKHILNQFMFV